MKKALILTLALGSLVAFTARADDKEVTLTGEGSCAKCELKKADSCQNAITVEKDGKKTVYLLEKNDVSNKFHKNVCSSTKKVKAKGTVKETDGKKIFTATEIAVVEK